MPRQGLRDMICTGSELTKYPYRIERIYQFLMMAFSIRSDLQAMEKNKIQGTYR